MKQNTGQCAGDYIEPPMRVNFETPHRLKRETSSGVLARRLEGRNPISSVNLSIKKHIYLFILIIKIL